MSELRDERRLLAGSDALYQQLVLASATASESWAKTMVAADFDVLLWPRDRGDFPLGVPYRVTTRVIEMGVWRITLCPEDALPAGVDRTTRAAVLRAEIALSGTEVPVPAVDQVVQCGLFGEVLYP